MQMKVWVFGLIGQKTLGLDNPNLFLMFFLNHCECEGQSTYESTFSDEWRSILVFGFFSLYGSSQSDD